jgi:hypothetical protein
MRLTRVLLPMKGTLGVTWAWGGRLELAVMVTASQPIPSRTGDSQGVGVLHDIIDTLRRGNIREHTILQRDGIA